MSAMLPRSVREEAEAAGYVHLDDAERELLTDFLRHALVMVAEQRFDVRMRRDEISVLVELRERIRLPYSRERWRRDLTRERWRP